MSSVELYQQMHRQWRPILYRRGGKFEETQTRDLGLVPVAKTAMDVYGKYGNDFKLRLNLPQSASFRM